MEIGGSSGRRVQLLYFEIEIRPTHFFEIARILKRCRTFGCWSNNAFVCNDNFWVYSKEDLNAAAYGMRWILQFSGIALEEHLSAFFLLLSLASAYENACARRIIGSIILMSLFKYVPMHLLFLKILHISIPVTGPRGKIFYMDSIFDEFFPQRKW